MNKRQRQAAMLSLLQWKATVAGLKHQALLLSGKFLEASSMFLSVLSPQQDTSPSQPPFKRLETAYSMFFYSRISSCQSVAIAEILQKNMPISFCTYWSGCFEQAIDQSIMLYFNAGKEKFSQQARLQKHIITLSSTFLLKGGHCPYFGSRTGMVGRKEVSTLSRLSVLDMMCSVMIEAPPKEMQKTQSILQMASSPMNSASSLVRYYSSVVQIVEPFRRVAMASKQCSLRMFCTTVATRTMSSPQKVKEFSSLYKEQMISATELMEMLIFSLPQIVAVKPANIYRILLIFSRSQDSSKRVRTNRIQLKLCCKKTEHLSIDTPFQTSKRSMAGQANNYSTSLKHFSMGREPFSFALHAIILMSTSWARYLTRLLGLCQCQQQCMSPTSKMAMKQGLQRLSLEYFERHLRKLQMAYSQQ